jgi:hypothetical protein
MQEYTRRQTRRRHTGEGMCDPDMQRERGGAREALQLRRRTKGFKSFWLKGKNKRKDLGEFAENRT